MGKRDVLLASIKKQGEDENIPNITLRSALFLRKIISDTKAENILEIGTANGYSTSHFADEIEVSGGHVTTIEFSEKIYKQAKNNFEIIGLSHLITQHLGNALDVIPKLRDNYDFVFIDGMKKRSLDFLLLVWDRVPTGGTIIIDDVIKFRHKMIGLYEYVDEKGLNSEIIQIDEDDGIMILRK